jgi:hypothetical protein
MGQVLLDRQAGDNVDTCGRSMSLKLTPPTAPDSDRHKLYFESQADRGTHGTA